MQTFIEALFDEGWSPSQILDGLERIYGAARRADIPSERTVQRIFNDLQAQDSSGLWSLGSSEATEAEVRLVPPVWAEVARRRRDRQAGFTQREASIIARASAALPELEPWDVWRLSLAYLRRLDGGTETADLDFLVGCAGEWMRADVDVDAREKARKAHFYRHRELWPDRPYMYLASAAELAELRGDPAMEGYWPEGDPIYATASVLARHHDPEKLLEGPRIQERFKSLYPTEHRPNNRDQSKSKRRKGNG